jgi:hypothetical protein
MCKVVHDWVEKFSQGRFESSRWCPTRSPCRDCDRSSCAAGGIVDSSWQEGNDRQCSNCTKVFPWFSIQHDHSVFWECAHGGCPENWRIENEQAECICPCNISYAMQMKEKICLTGWLLGTTHGASRPARIKACFSAMETSHFTFNQKVYFAVSWEVYAYLFWDS